MMTTHSDVINFYLYLCYYIPMVFVFFVYESKFLILLLQFGSMLLLIILFS